MELGITRHALTFSSWHIENGLHSQQTNRSTKKNGERIVIGSLEDTSELHDVVAQKSAFFIDMSCIPSRFEKTTLGHERFLVTKHSEWLGTRFDLLVRTTLLLDGLEVLVERLNHLRPPPPVSAKERKRRTTDFVLCYEGGNEK